MICVSLQEKNFQQCMELIRRFECCEIRLDLCRFSCNEIRVLFASHPRLVATCRPTDTGDEERKKILFCAIEAGAAYVDIEMESSLSFKMDIIHKAREHRCATILSYHNYEYTPPATMLENIIEEGFSHGVDVVKIATYVRVERDNAALMSVYGKGRRLIVFGMGEKGMITRVAAPLLGAEFTFACVDEDSATAPGQIPYERLKKIYQLMQPDSSL